MLAERSNPISMRRNPNSPNVPVSFNCLTYMPSTDMVVKTISTKARMLNTYHWGSRTASSMDSRDSINEGNVPSRKRSTPVMIVTSPFCFTSLAVSMLFSF